MPREPAKASPQVAASGVVRAGALVALVDENSAQVEYQIVEPEAAKTVAPAKRAADGPSGSLAGKRLLMVEDEFLVGLMAKRILEGFGAVVAGPYGRLADALMAAKADPFDGAVLEGTQRIAQYIVRLGLHLIEFFGGVALARDRKQTYCQSRAPKTPSMQTAPARIARQIAELR